MEIHQINVGQGDSILIINRDLAKVKQAIEDKPETPPPNPLDYVPFALSKKVPLLGTGTQALLIDGGDDCYGGNVGAYLIEQGLPNRPSGSDGVYCKNFSVLVSHWHDDHMQGVKGAYGQRDATPIETRKPKRKRGKGAAYKKPPLFIRPATMYVPKPRDREGPRRKIYRNEMARVATAGSLAEPSKRVDIGPGGLAKGATGPPFTIDLGKGIGDIPIVAHVLAAAQSVYFDTGPVQIASKGRGVDQNDTSVVLVIEYGSFRYFCAGDIAGNGVAAGGNTSKNAMDTKKKNNYSLTHADVESTLGPALERYFQPTVKYEADKPKCRYPGQCTVMKLSHHGSNSSNDVYLLATLRPKVVVGSSGLRHRFHWHPTAEVINRITTAATGKWDVRPVKVKPPPPSQPPPPPPPPLPPVPNEIAAVCLTEVADKIGKRGKTFDVDLQGAKIMGSIVVRPIDESVLAVQQATAAGKSKLSFQVYGNGLRTDLTKAGLSYSVRATVDKAKSGFYPIEPDVHEVAY